MEPSVRLQVDGVARTECDELQVSSDAIDDPEPAHPIAAKSPKFVAERLARVGVLQKRLERGSDLALEHGMKSADERRDLVRNFQAAWPRHAVVSRRRPLAHL